MAQKRESLRAQADGLRKALVLEPRGHADMVAALFTEPVSPGSHAGILFMDGGGFPAMSGHGILAAGTIGVARELFFSRDWSGPDVRLVFDTPGGVVHTV